MIILHDSFYGIKLYPMYIDIFTNHRKYNFSSKYNLKSGVTKGQISRKRIYEGGLKQVGYCSMGSKDHVLCDHLRQSCLGKKHGE